MCPPPPRVNKEINILPNMITFIMKKKIRDKKLAF